MAKHKSSGGGIRPEPGLVGTRQLHRREGGMPSARDAGDTGKPTTPKPYKRGGSVKPSTPKTY